MDRFRPGEAIRWAVEIDGIVLLNELTGKSIKLTYPQAALWDFISRGDSPNHIPRKLALVASLELAAAERLAEEAIAGLVRDGFLLREGIHG
jgi:hypothetical protein